MVRANQRDQLTGCNLEPVSPLDARLAFIVLDEDHGSAVVAAEQTQGPAQPSALHLVLCQQRHSACRSPDRQLCHL